MQALAEPAGTVSKHVPTVPTQGQISFPLFPIIVTNPKSNIIVDVFILSLIDYSSIIICFIFIDNAVTVTKISIKVIKIIKILSKVIKILDRLQHCGGE